MWGNITQYTGLDSVLEYLNLLSPPPPSPPLLLSQCLTNICTHSHYSQLAASSAPHLRGKYLGDKIKIIAIELSRH